MTGTRAPRVAFVATARPTFAVDVALERAVAAREALIGLGAQVHGVADLVMTPEDVARSALLPFSDVDLIVNLCASFSDATPALSLYSDVETPVLLWAVPEPGPVGERLWLNSLCGANLFGHALRVSSGRSPHLLYGDPADSAVLERLRECLAGRLPAIPGLPLTSGPRSPAVDAVTSAMATLAGKTLGTIGEAPAGFTPSAYDGATLSALFGLTVAEISVDEAFSRVRSVDPATASAEGSAAVAAQPSWGRLDEAQVHRAAEVTSALRSWRDQDSLSGMAVRCWPEFPTTLGVCPCSSLGRLADEGTPTACERDVYGAVTMMVLEALGSGPTYLVDTVDLEVETNIVRLWHCGSAATVLAADPANARQDVHCNRRIGVAGNFALRTGPVIMARLTEDPGTSNLRLLIAAGESVPEPNRFQGNTAAVRLETPAEDFVNTLVTGGFPHHTVLAWTDVRPQLRRAADLLAIPVVEFVTAESSGSSS